MRILKKFAFVSLFVSSVCIASQDHTYHGLPSVGPMKDHKIDFVTNLEFLWLKSSMTNLDYAYKFRIEDSGNELTPNTNIPVPTKTERFDWGWHPGLRVGIGVVTNHSGWDIYGSWMYYFADDHQHKVVPSILTSGFNQLPAGTEFYGSPWHLFGVVAEVTDIKASWSLVFNQMDLELGRNFFLGRSLAIHPFCGVRALWARIDLTARDITTFTDPESDNQFNNLRNRFREKFSGAGLLGGIKSSWMFYKHWSIVTNGSASLIYGPVKLQSKFRSFQLNNTFQVVRNFRATNHIGPTNTLIPNLDLGLGIRFDTTFSNNSYRLQLEALWENHFYYDINQLNKNLSSDRSFAQQNFFSSDGNLMLSGLVFKGRFEF